MFVFGNCNWSVTHMIIYAFKHAYTCIYMFKEVFNLKSQESEETEHVEKLGYFCEKLYYIPISESIK